MHREILVYRHPKHGERNAEVVVIHGEKQRYYSKVSRATLRRLSDFTFTDNFHTTAIFDGPSTLISITPGSHR